MSVSAKSVPAASKGPASLSFLKLAGPGLVVAATGIGSGDVVAATVGGARYGVILLWAIAVGEIDGDDLSPQAVGLITAVFNRPASAPPSVLDTLTAAERLVAERGAHGLTSRKIAEELFVSPRTVDAHLTHIYRKLDINTRARLAALVMEQTRTL